MYDIDQLSYIQCITVSNIRNKTASPASRYSLTLQRTKCSCRGKFNQIAKLLVCNQKILINWSRQTWLGAGFEQEDTQGLLHVPTFPVNLLSVSLAVNELNCSVYRNGLYFLRQDDVDAASCGKDMYWGHGMPRETIIEIAWSYPNSYRGLACSYCSREIGRLFR